LARIGVNKESGKRKRNWKENVIKRERGMGGVGVGFGILVMMLVFWSVGEWF